MCGVFRELNGGGQDSLELPRIKGSLSDSRLRAALAATIGRGYCCDSKLLSKRCIALLRCRDALNANRYNRPEQGHEAGSDSLTIVPFDDSSHKVLPFRSAAHVKVQVLSLKDEIRIALLDLRCLRSYLFVHLDEERRR